MWWIIIIAILVFSFFKFAIDNNEQANAVAKQGGMRNKYRTIVDYVKSGHPNSKIVHEDGTSIRVGAASAGGSTYFDIVQTFGSVTIQWKSTSVLMGNHKLEWQFNEFMDQSEMIECIEHDISVYMSNVISKYQ